jgi:mycothiol synthase
MEIREIVETMAEDLPAGYTARPATLDDAAATVDMLNTASRALSGDDEHTVAGWQGDWQAPGFDLGSQTRLVLAPDGAVAGYAGLWAMAPFTLLEQWGQVHPAHTGRGLGSYLLAWAEAAARPYAARAGQPARLHTWARRDDTATQALLGDQGFCLVRHYLRMAMDWTANTPPAAPAWPEGVRVRAFNPGTDDEATYGVIRAAFSDSWDYVEVPFEEGLARWRHFYKTDETFDPSLWFLAVTGEGLDERIIGTTFVRWSLTEDPERAWIRTIGVLREWRRRGIAEALLRHAFSELDRRGRRKAALGVDAASPTGATRLYEKAGMTPVAAKMAQVWEKPLADKPGAN